MGMNTKIINEDGNEVDIAIKLDMYMGVSVETEDDLSRFENGDILTLVLFGEKGIFGTPTFANIELEVVQIPYSTKTLVLKEIKGAR